MQLTTPPTICSGRASVEFRPQIALADGLDLHRVLQYPPEEQPPRMRGATVEAEGKLVKVVVKMARGHGALVGAQQPALQQRDNQVHLRQQLLPAVRPVCVQRTGRTDYRVTITSLRQSLISGQAISFDTTARLDEQLQCTHQRLAPGVAHTKQTNPAQTSPGMLHRRQNHALAFSATSTLAGTFSTPAGLINLHRAAQPLPAGAHHRPPQPMQPGPSGMIAAQPQHPLQPQRAGPVLLASHIPDGLEPHPQRIARVVEQGSGGHRHALATAPTLIPALRQLPGLAVTTPGTDEAIAPADRRQIGAAGLFRGRQRVEGLLVAREGLHSPVYYM